MFRSYQVFMHCAYWFGAFLTLLTIVLPAYAQVQEDKFKDGGVHFIGDAVWIALIQTLGLIFLILFSRIWSHYEHRDTHTKLTEIGGIVNGRFDALLAEKKRLEEEILAWNNKSSGSSGS